MDLLATAVYWIFAIGIVLILIKAIYEVVFGKGR